MINIQRIDDDNKGSQQIQAGGDVTAPFAENSGIAIGRDNYGVVISSVPTPDDPQYTFLITKKTRIPTPTALIGLISGLITIAGFVTGGLSIKQLVERFRSGEALIVASGIPAAYWWSLASVLMIVISLLGWSFFRFLRRNVLRLPKRWVFRSWAGIKEANGRTYPYALRLAMRCPKCRNQKLRFQQVPAESYDLFDTQTGARKKTIVTKWESMAVCPRDERHSIPVDISGNDFESALPR